jgi:hypothetical protein
VYADAIHRRSASPCERVPIPFADPYHDGFVLALWDVEVTKEVLAALFARMTAIGARHLTIPVFGCQSDPRSADVGSCEVASRGRALELARAGRDHGLTVGFLPIVASKRWEWRGEFEPSDRAGWFERYTHWIVALARDARELGASELVVGTEFTRLYRRAKEWSQVIAETRRAFDGPVVVSVNWSDLDLEFWGDADAIGISAYYPLTAKGAVAEEDLDASWRAIREKILRVARAHGRPVHITEFGYPAMTHAAARPWDGDTPSPPDPDLQARCFEAFRRAWQGDRTLVRVNVWAMGDPRRDDPRGFGITGKPAEAVIRRMFLDRARY